VGGEYLFAGAALRSRVMVGPCVLLFDAALHDRGAVGVYAEARPLGVRFRVLPHLGVWLDPLTVAYMQPTLGEGPVIRMVQYRTVLGVELSS
jgi:hypothetical protein